MSRFPDPHTTRRRKGRFARRAAALPAMLVCVALTAGAALSSPAHAASSLTCNPANAPEPPREDGPAVLASTTVGGPHPAAQAGAAIAITQAVTHDPIHGVDYAAYYDASFTLTVSARRADGTWTTVQPQQPLNDASGRQIGWKPVTLPKNASDSHEELNIGIDSTGAMHLAGAVHNQPMLYWRQTIPGDPGSLRFRTELPGMAKWGFLVAYGLETVVSYPHFFTGGDGNLHLTFRNGITNAGNQYIYSYDPTTATWTSRTGLAPLWNGAGSFTPSPDGFGPYPTTPVWRDDAEGGAFHVAWVWRGFFHSGRTPLRLSWTRESTAAWSTARSSSVSTTATGSS